MTALATTHSDVLPAQGRTSLSESGEMEGASREQIKNLYQRGKERAVEAEESFENYVRDHPVRSVLIATGVGVAVGVLLGRRR
jgi:ElaB/YqjD/DUF883 family membrane-anchored ribosome-binding protein